MTAMDVEAMTDSGIVAEYPGVCGGYPVIRNTRIAVRMIVELSRRGLTLDEMAAMWPTVSVPEIRGALEYYAREPQRVDEDIARHVAAERGAQRTLWSA